MTTEEKIAYLAELRRLLATLPQEERDAALTYYEEYFDDAGPEEIERVIGELGPARALAAQILSGYSRDYLDALPGSSHKHLPARPEDAKEARHREEEARAGAEGNQEDQAEREHEQEAQAHAQAGREQTRTHQQAQAARPAAAPPRRSGATVLLIVLLAIFALPLLLPLAALVLGLVVGLAGLMLGLGAGIGAMVLTVLAAGIGLLVIGFSLLAVHALEALLALGLGLILLGVGSIMLLICVFILVKVLPAVLRFLFRILCWPFERRVVRA